MRVAVGDIYRNGRWFSTEQESLDAGASGISFRSHDIRPREPGDAGRQNSIHVSGFGPAQFILSGPLPTSLHAQSFSTPVSYLVPSHTVLADGHDQYGWDAFVYEYSAEQLLAVPAWAVTHDSPYTRLPNGLWVEQARLLAIAITAEESTVYGRPRRSSDI